MKRMLILLIGLLGGAGLLPAAATVGFITKDETWSGVVSLTGDVVVSTNVTLTIMPGTRVEARAGRDSSISLPNMIHGTNPNRIELIVQGSLMAEGKEGQPITFTSQPASIGAPRNPGDWHGLRLLHGTNQTIQLSFVNVEYGTEGIAVETSLADPIAHCLIQSNSISGVNLSRPVTLLDCQIVGNREGLHMSAATTATATNCTFRSNADLAGRGYVGGGTMVLDHSLVTSAGNGTAGNGFGDLADLTLTASRYSSNRVGLSAANITLTDSVVEGSCPGARGDLGPFSVLANYLVATRSQFRANGTGVNVWFGATFEDCELVSNEGFGLACQPPDWVQKRGELTLRRSRIEDSPFGIFSRFITQLTISDSTVSGCSRDGIWLPRSPNLVVKNVSIENSVVSNNGGAGLSISEVGSGSIHGNTIENNAVGLVIESQVTIGAGVIFDNCITRNNGHQLNNVGPGGIVADGNFWGEVTTGELKKNKGNLTEIQDYDDSNGNPQIGPVYINSWLDHCPCTEPKIVGEPDDVSVVEGGSATFTVSAEGQALTYQWFHGGVAVPGATEATLVVSPAQVAEAGAYHAVVGNDCGTTNSRAASLTVLGPPRILRQPVAVRLPAGQNASFTVEAGGTAPLTYQWRLNGVALAEGGRLAGTTRAKLDIAAVQLADEGEYSVTVSNAVGSTNSVRLRLDVIRPPVISQPPTNTLVRSGSDAVFRVGEPGGTPPFGYQWSFNGQPIPGATEATLTVSNAQPANLGAYTVEVTNPAGHPNTQANPAYLYLDDLKVYAGVVLAGPLGGRIRIEVMPKFGGPAVWQVWTNVILETSPQVIIDYGSAAEPQRYYRPLLAP